MDTTTLLIYIMAITAFLLTVMSMPMQYKIMKSRKRTGPEASNLPVAFFLFSILQSIAILLIALFVAYGDTLLLLHALVCLNANGIISVFTYIGSKFKLK